MKKILLLVMIALTASCYVQPTNDNMETTCLDGVSYWYKVGSRISLLAPRYDADTGEIVRCPKE